MKKKLVIFSGAGVSAESGLDTFRDDGGIWANYDINDVATPEAWLKNPNLVLDFYNTRRRIASDANPNIAHKEIAKLEDILDVTVITQNIDNLHERGGSSNVIHLHGEVDKVRSTGTDEVYLQGVDPLLFGDVCPNGHQLRPHIVWFGEQVPNLTIAEKVISKADFLIVIGTSLNVYPAAGLIHAASDSAPKYLVDPSDNIKISKIENLKIFKEKATIGIPKVAELIRKEFR